MAERKVDVFDGDGVVLRTFTFPDAKGGEAPSDTDLVARALQAARDAQLVPAERFGQLNAVVQPQQNVPAATEGDLAPPLEQAERDFDAAVRDTAYFLWEQDGRPEGKAEIYWHRALEQHYRERAYSRWLLEGKPEGRDQEIWNAAKDEAKQ